ncbi:hypothetical protein WJX74_000474 [Apatococcus lobatus]|uniref:Uncharacterized protein n=1 Tax=Apatococcus lobatus TaxID=904363 RepID=A0AAW1RYX7_9CHLO
MTAQPAHAEQSGHDEKDRRPRQQQTAARVADAQRYFAAEILAGSGFTIAEGQFLHAYKNGNEDAADIATVIGNGLRRRIRIDCITLSCPIATKCLAGFVRDWLSAGVELFKSLEQQGTMEPISFVPSDGINVQRTEAYMQEAMRSAIATNCTEIVTDHITDVVAEQLNDQGKRYTVQNNINSHCHGIGLFAETSASSRLFNDTAGSELTKTRYSWKSTDVDLDHIQAMAAQGERQRKERIDKDDAQARFHAELCGRDDSSELHAPQRVWYLSKYGGHCRAVLHGDWQPERQCDGMLAIRREGSSQIYPARRAELRPMSGEETAAGSDAHDRAALKFCTDLVIDLAMALVITEGRCATHYHHGHHQGECSQLSPYYTVRRRESNEWLTNNRDRACLDVLLREICMHGRGDRLGSPGPCTFFMQQPRISTTPSPGDCRAALQRHELRSADAAQTQQNLQLLRAFGPPASTSSASALRMAGSRLGWPHLVGWWTCKALHSML